MRVLEVLQEQEKPLRLINPDELDITNPEEKKLKINNPELKKVSAQGYNDDFIKTAKRFGMSDDDIKKLQKKSTATSADGKQKKWTDAFSTASWYLIFYISKYQDFKKMGVASRIKSDLDDNYDRLVRRTTFKTPMAAWIMNASTMAKVFTTSQKPEGIIKELKGRVQNTFGITIGPSWVPSKNDNPNPKHRTDYELFLQAYGAKALAPGIRTIAEPIKAGNIKKDVEYVIVNPSNTDFTKIGAENNFKDTVFIATGPGEGEGTVRPTAQSSVSTTVQKDQTKPLTKSEANAIAQKLYNSLFKIDPNPFSWFNDDDDDETLGILRREIKDKDAWEKVQDAWKEIYPKERPLDKEILSDFSNTNDKKFNVWLASLDPNLAFNQKDLATYSDKEDDQNLPPKELIGTINKFNEKFLQKEPKYRKFVDKKQGLKIWKAWQKLLLKKLKTESQKSTPPRITVKEFKSIWFENIKQFKSQADNLIK